MHKTGAEGHYTVNH